MNENILWLALCIYFESRGEPIEAQLGVGHVVLNRTAAKHMSVKQVVQQPYQFSWYNEDVEPPVIRELSAFADCMDSALECLKQRLQGETFLGADHFYDNSIDAPYWAKEMTLIAQRGRILFYKS